VLVASTRLAIVSIDCFRSLTCVPERQPRPPGYFG
jgi:hypothetical protein